MRTRATIALAVLGALVAATPVTAVTRTTRPVPTTRAATVPASTTAAPSAATLRMALAFPPRSGLSVLSDDAVLLSRLGVTETLVRATSSGDAQPLLATSWDQTGTTSWRFKLRSGVAFHDGTPMDAAAVVNSITRAMATAAPPRALRGSGITASVVDPLTVEVTTPRPDPLVPLRLSAPGSAILAAGAYRGAAPTAIGTATGIYRIESFVPDQRIELAANAKHWGRPPSIQKVVNRLINDPAARVTALRAGELDLVEGVPPAQLDAVRKDAALQALIFDLPRTTTLYLNTSKPPFDTVTARRAVDLAIDRAALASILLEGAAVPAAGYFGPAVAWDPDTQPPKQDLNEARRLAEQAKLPRRIRLWTYTARAELPDLAVAIKDMLGRAGIEVEITVAEYASLEPDVLAGRHDMFLLSRSYMVDLPDPAGFLASDFTCAGSFNLNRWCDTRLDAELGALGTQGTKSARERAFASVSRAFDVDVVGVPVLHDRARLAHTRKLTGLVADPMEQRLLTSELRLAS
jgi:peptide/nickel transport system substrate-binding protein